jgi:hypothetical protein
MSTWDRSRDWVLRRLWNDLLQFRHTAPAAVRGMIGHSGVLALGVLATPEARRLIERAQGEGLEVVAENASFVSYLPYDGTTGCAWLIEDDAEAAAIVQAMPALVPLQTTGAL